MPRKRKPKKPEPTYDDLYFSLEDWQYSDSQHINLGKTPRKNFGPVSQYTEVRLRGPIISKTNRRIDRAELLVWPKGPDPGDWPEGCETVGAVLQVVQGTITIAYDVTVAVFQNLLTAVATGHIVEFSVTIKGLRHGRGQVVGARIGTERSDPDDLP